MTPAQEIGKLANRILQLAPKAGLYVGIKIEAAHPTPDRSGEADKTGTGLAEGESGLPEGSSK